MQVYLMDKSIHWSPDKAGFGVRNCLSKQRAAWHLLWELHIFVVSVASFNLSRHPSSLHGAFIKTERRKQINGSLGGRDGGSDAGSSSFYTNVNQVLLTVLLRYCSTSRNVLRHELRSAQGYTNDKRCRKK